ncbi:MAG: hypothetical protein R3C05_27245 [Pirellulaceae bacterium]
MNWDLSVHKKASGSGFTGDELPGDPANMLIFPDGTELALDLVSWSQSQSVDSPVGSKRTSENIAFGGLSISYAMDANTPGLIQALTDEQATG